MSAIRIVAELEIKPEYKDSLEPVLKALVAGSRAEAGNIEYDFTVTLENACHFFIIETWVSQAAIEEHNSTQHFQAFVKALEGKTNKLAITRLKSLY